MATIMTKLLQLRRGRFLTQLELAQMAGVTEATINRIEKGHNKPTFQTIKKLARALGVEPNELDF